MWANLGSKQLQVLRLLHAHHLLASGQVHALNFARTSRPAWHLGDLPACGSAMPVARHQPLIEAPMARGSGGRLEINRHGEMGSVRSFGDPRRDV